MYYTLYIKLFKHYMNRKESAVRSYIAYVVVGLIFIVGGLLSYKAPFTLDQWVTEGRWIILDMLKLFGMFALLIVVQVFIAKAKMWSPEIEEKYSDEDEMQYSIRLKRQSEFTKKYDYTILLTAIVVLSMSNIYISTYTLVFIVVALFITKYIGLLIQHFIDQKTNG